MSDDVDEWVFNIRQQLGELEAQGATETTMTFSIRALHILVDCFYMYHREEDVERCFLCGMRRDLEIASKEIANLGLGRNPNWRKDADPRRPRWKP